MNMMNKPTVGLFGTCGNSKWREPFIALYDSMNVPYFNPQVPNWNSELAAKEAEHLATDPIVLIPITNETSGIGSLAEVGFTVAQAAINKCSRNFVIYIAPTVDETLVTDPGVAKESNRARKLVLAHLHKLQLNNVMVVNSLEHMLDVSVDLIDRM